MTTVQIGPLVLPLGLLVLLAALAAALYIGRRVGRRSGVDPESVLWQSVLIGSIAARLVFVWQYRSAYRADPLGVLDIRDGGWNPVAWLVGAWLFAMSRLPHHATAKKAVVVALTTGTAPVANGQPSPGLASGCEKLLATM